MTTETITLQHLDLQPGDPIPDWVDPDTFISPDPPPLPDAMHQEPHFTDVMSTLRRHLRKQPNWETTLISGDSHLYYDRGNLNNRYEPDCYVAFDVDVGAIWPRNGYMTWIADKPPDFALEIASKSTGPRDMIIKRRDYARIGIREYWRFDATGRRLPRRAPGRRPAGERGVPTPSRRKPNPTAPSGVTARLWICGWFGTAATCCSGTPAPASSSATSTRQMTTGRPPRMRWPKRRRRWQERRRDLKLLRKPSAGCGSNRTKADRTQEADNV